MSRYNLINSILCCMNPRVCISPTHYVCGKNLALFANFAQIENCLTGFTSNCKCLTNNPQKCLSSNNALRDDIKN